MPRTIDEGFRDFLKKLTPSSAETEAVKRHRASIEACLKSNFGLKRFTRIGSFGNGTSVLGFSDTDYLACIPTGYLTNSSTYSLKKIRDALATRYPSTAIRVNCPAIACPFGITAAARTEIVPSDEVGESNGYKVYEIADGSGGWMYASPDAHNAYVRSVDEKLGGKVKPLIRFIKAWKYICNAPISSFYLELRVAKFAATEKDIVYEYDVYSVFKMLWDNQLASMQDPMGVSGNIQACATDAKKQAALSKLRTAYARAIKARQASDQGHISAAFDWWRAIYDNKFPTYYL